MCACTHTHITVTLTPHAIESGPPEIGVEDFLHRWIVDPLGGVCAPLALGACVQVRYMLIPILGCELVRQTWVG